MYRSSRVGGVLQTVGRFGAVDIGVHFALKVKL